jgi:hypothetical protein
MYLYYDVITIPKSSKKVPRIFEEGGARGRERGMVKGHTSLSQVVSRE